MLIGARSGGRTRIPFRMRDFKSLAYTNFAIRAERCSWPPRWIAAAQDYNQLPGFTQPHRSCIGGGCRVDMRAMRSTVFFMPQTKSPASVNLRGFRYWRPMSESNRRTRICNPLHNHSANRPQNNEAAFSAASSTTNWSGKRDFNLASNSLIVKSFPQPLYRQRTQLWTCLDKQTTPQRGFSSKDG